MRSTKPMNFQSFMSKSNFESSPLFLKKTGPLTPSEIQWMLSCDGGEAPAEVTEIRTEKVRKIFCEIPANSKVLDVGCANGAVLKSFTGKHELHGVDISEVLVEAACANGFKAKVHDLMQGPLPYADGTFDVVFNGENIEHQLDTDWLLLEINRVLKPGGKLVLTFPNIRTPTGIAMMLFFDMPPMYSSRYRSGHFRDFTLRSIKLALGKHGFQHTKSVGSAFFLPKIGEFWSGLASLLPSWSHQIVTVATKVENSKYVPDSWRKDSRIFGS